MDRRPGAREHRCTVVVGMPTNKKSSAFRNLSRATHISASKRGYSTTRSSGAAKAQPSSNSCISATEAACRWPKTLAARGAARAAGVPKHRATVAAYLPESTQSAPSCAVQTCSRLSC